MVEICKVDTTNIQIHDHSPYWLGTDIKKKSDWAKLILWAQMFLKKIK